MAAPIPMTTKAANPHMGSGRVDAPIGLGSAVAEAERTVRLLPVDGMAAERFRAFSITEAARLERYFPGAFRAGGSVEASRAYLKRLRRNAENRVAFAFAILTPGSEKIAGLLFLNRICPDSGVAEAAGVIGARWEGQGHMRQAMTMLFRWTHAQLRLRRVRLLIGVDNARSRSLANGLGFRREHRGGRVFRSGTRWEELLEYHCLFFD